MNSEATFLRRWRNWHSTFFRLIRWIVLCFSSWSENKPYFSKCYLESRILPRSRSLGERLTLSYWLNYKVLFRIKQEYGNHKPKQINLRFAFTTDFINIPPGSIQHEWKEIRSQNLSSLKCSLLKWAGGENTGEKIQHFRAKSTSFLPRSAALQGQK